QAISLTGTGASPPAPAVNLSATNLLFGGQPVGVSTSAQTVTLNNTGTAPLLLTISVSGDFAESDTCGTTVAAGASCTLSITFTPVTTGIRNGAVTITDNAADSPQSIALTGTGLP